MTLNRNLSKRVRKCAKINETSSVKKTSVGPFRCHAPNVTTSLYSLPHYEILWLVSWVKWTAALLKACKYSGTLDIRSDDSNTRPSAAQVKVNTEWRTKFHTIYCTHNTFLLLQKHLASGTELILLGWKIVPNESLCIVCLQGAHLVPKCARKRLWVGTTRFGSA